MKPPYWLHVTSWVLLLVFVAVPAAKLSLQAPPTSFPVHSFLGAGVMFVVSVLLGLFGLADDINTAVFLGAVVLAAGAFVWALLLPDSEKEKREKLYAASAAVGSFAAGVKIGEKTAPSSKRKTKGKPQP